jgi:DNA-binding SARP family transcriptional activator
MHDDDALFTSPTASAVLHQDALQQLARVPADKRLIVLHPRYANQRLLFSAFLDGQDAAHTAYARLMNRPATAEDIAGQVAAQVNSRDRYTWLVLDEADRAPDTSLAAFLRQHLMQLPRVRIALAVRALPAQVLYHPDLRGLALLLPTSDGFMLHDYAADGMTPTLAGPRTPFEAVLPAKGRRGAARQHEPDVRHVVEVYGFGSGRAVLNGREIDQWDGSLPRMLFFFLIDRGMVMRREIFATFWETLSTHEATNVFHVTKRKVSEVLGIDLTVYGSGFYHIAPNVQVHYDVAHFNALVQESQYSETDQSVRQLETAVRLYRDDYLTSVHMPWAEQRRADLRQTLTDALAYLARAYETRGQFDRALNTYLRAFSLFPMRDDIALQAITLYGRLNRPADAQAVFEHHCRALEASLRMQPSRQVLQAMQALGERR